MQRRLVPCIAALNRRDRRDDSDAEDEQHTGGCASRDHQAEDTAKQHLHEQYCSSRDMPSGGMSDQEQPQHHEQVLGFGAFQALLSVWVYIAAGGTQYGHDTIPDSARHISLDDATGSSGVTQHEDEKQPLQFDPEVFNGIAFTWLISATVFFGSSRAAGFDLGESYRIVCGVLLGLLVDQAFLKLTPYSLIAQDALRDLIRTHWRSNRLSQQATQLTNATSLSSPARQQAPADNMGDQKEETDIIDIVFYGMIGTIRLAQVFVFTFAVYRFPQWLLGWDDAVALQLALPALWGVLLTTLVVLPLIDWYTGNRPGS